MYKVYSFWHTGKSAAVIIIREVAISPLPFSVYRVSLSIFFRCDNKDRPDLRIKAQPLFHIYMYMYVRICIYVYIFFKQVFPEHLLHV